MTLGRNPYELPPVKPPPIEPPTPPVTERPPDTEGWLAFKLEELQDMPWEERLVEIRRQAEEAGIELPRSYQRVAEEAKGLIEKWEEIGEKIIEHPVTQALSLISGLVILTVGGIAAWQMFGQRITQPIAKMFVGRTYHKTAEYRALVAMAKATKQSLKSKTIVTLDKELRRAFDLKKAGNARPAQEIVDRLRNSFTRFMPGVARGKELIVRPPGVPAPRPPVALPVTPPVAPVIPAMTTAMTQQLGKLGYTAQAITQMTPAIAQGIITAGTIAPLITPPPTIPAVSEVTPELQRMSTMTDKEFIANPPKGFKYDATLREGLLAHRGTDETIIGDAFFKLPTKERLSLLRHEEGHDLMRNFNRDWKDVLEPIRKNKEQPLGAKSRWNNPFGLSDRAEELVADAYTSLWDGSTRWFDDPNYPTNKILKQVIEIARREGKPLPSESEIQFVSEAAKPPAVEVAPVEIAPPEPVIAPVEAPSIPKELPTTPPTLPPEAVTLGRTENEWVGFMADLQDAQIVADVAFRDDLVRRWINLLPEIKGFFKVMNPSAIANTPAEQAIIIRAVLRDEGYQKTQGITSFLNELGSQEKIFGGLDEKGLIKSGALKSQSLGDIAEHRLKWEAKLTDEQKVWLDRAEVIEDSIIEFLQKNEIDINLLRLEEGGQFATRRVWARTLNDGSVIDTAYVGAGPGRPGARLPTERHRMFKTEFEAIKAGYRYLPYEEALYLKVSGAYNRVADKKMADWLLTKVTWRTTGAPEELKLVAEQAILKKRHSQQLLSALNRAVRGERIPDVTIRSIATSYPDQAQKLKDLIPRLQRGEPTAKEVQSLTRVARGLINTNKANAQRAINARARAREKALVTKIGEAIIPAPAFAGKILTGPGAKETANALRRAFDPSFSKALGQINKANAVARYFMLAGDFSPFMIQLIFLMGENPVIYGKAFAGAMRALFDPKFHSKYLLKHKATIDKHPNLLITKAGATEFTEAMARGGWLSGKTALVPMNENYWKTLGLFLPRVVGKVGGAVLTPFQRVFEMSLDYAGIELAEAYDYLATTPERTADVDQFINEFRGLTSSARIGVSVQQRQIETMLILAPRYNRAIAGLLYDLGRGGIRGSLARKALIKGIAALVAITAVISIARGESQEEILDHYNPLSPYFFTWDVAGQKIGPGSKVRSVIKVVAQSVDNPDSLFRFGMESPAFRFVRGNLSPVVGSGYDLITGRSYIGDPTRDGMLSFSKEIIAGNLLPIWVQTVLLEGGDVRGRTIRGIAEFFGGRAYPEPLWGEVGKLRDTYAKQDFNVKYEDLNRMQTDRLRLNHPDLKDLEDKARLEGVERGTEFEKWVFETMEQIVTERNDALEKAAVILLSGLMSKRDYDSERGYARPYYSGAVSILWLARESLDPYSIKQIEKWMGENQKPEDKAVDKYQEFRANLIGKADLPKDWDKIEAHLEAYLSRLPKSLQNYIKANVNRWINNLPVNAQRVERMRLASIEDETWWDDYREIRVLPRAAPTPTREEGVLGTNPYE